MMSYLYEGIKMHETNMQMVTNIQDFHTKKEAFENSHWVIRPYLQACHGIVCIIGHINEQPWFWTDFQEDIRFRFSLGPTALLNRFMASGQSRQRQNQGRNQVWSLTQFVSVCLLVRHHWLCWRANHRTHFVTHWSLTVRKVNRIKLWPLTWWHSGWDETRDGWGWRGLAWRW